MRVLLAEGCAADAAALGHFLEARGHDVSVCAAAADALACYARARHDLVIIDADLPPAGGLALAQELQNHAAPERQAVILIADQFDANLLTQALADGCDACLPKPVDGACLDKRLAVLTQQFDTQRASASHLARLAEYLEAEEADLRIARHLIEHQLLPDGIGRYDDPAVQSWRLSCPALGGDMLSVSRTPSGVLHVLLADAKESGLSAYVSLLPLINPFYRMTEKGFPLASIVRELNSKLRQTLPPERKVAAQLVAVDRREGIVGVWNGGMPEAFMLDGFGRHLREFGLQHEPFGVLDDEAFDERIEQHAFTPGEQLVMATDGLLDCLDGAGQRFGKQGLLDTLAGLPRSSRRAEAVASIEALLGDAAAKDDMSLVLIDCEREADAIVPLGQKPAHAGMPGNWFFEIRLGASELGRLDVVPLLLHVVGQFHLGGDCGGKLFIILSELFNNALDHGVLRLDSRLKQSPDGMETWLERREESLARLEDGEVRLSVEQFLEEGRVWLRLVCRDSGPGFDVDGVLDEMRQRHTGCHPDMLPFGRGLLLLQNMAHSVEYGGGGSMVTVLLEIGQG